MMIRIGVVSDTHLPAFGTALPAALVRGLREAAVERILHCGDLTDALAADLFEAIAPFDAVAGNNDGGALRTRFGRRKIVEIAGVRIGMVHGDEGRARSTEERAIAAFDGETVDVILYGHSHRPVVTHHGRALVANPGSPTDKRLNPFYTYAILTLGDGPPRCELHRYLSRAT